MMGDHLTELREILYGEPSRRAWDRVCDLFERWPADSAQIGLDYAQGLLTGWPDAERRARGRWTALLYDHAGALSPSPDASPPRAWPLVRAMSVDTGQIDAAALEALGRSTWLAPLTILKMSTDPRQRLSSLTGPMVEAIARWPALGQLKVLDLSFNNIDDRGAEALAECEALADLQVLDLSLNLIRDAGAEALAGSRWLARLERLDLGRNSIGEAGRASLNASPWLSDAVKRRLGVR